MLATHAAYHPLAPAAGVAVVAGAGLAVATAIDLRPAVAAWWVLVGLTSGYALSGSV
jgi:hypothetical protein